MRIRVSNIAGLCGLNEWTDLPSLICELVYQDNGDLRKKDAEAWGIVWINEEDQIRDLLKRKGKGAKRIREALANAQKDDSSTSCSANQAKSLVAKALKKEASLFTSEEARLIENAARHSVNTNFGKRMEASAIVEYAKVTGWEVTGCNEEIYTWKFPSRMEDVEAPGLLMRDEGRRRDGQGSRRSPTERHIALRSVVDRFCHFWGLPKGKYKKLSPLAKSMWDSSDVGDGWIRLTGALSSGDRRFVHSLAEGRGLGHESNGNGATRRVTLQVASTPLDRGSMRSSCQGRVVTEVIRSLLEATISLAEEEEEESHSSGIPSEGDDAANRDIGDLCDRANESEEEEDDADDDNVADAIELVGMVDGIAHELDCGDADPDNWTLKPLVVEIKHRMGTGYTRAPPLYEHIQCVCYMLLLGCEHADLVQVHRIASSSSSALVTEDATAKKRKTSEGERARESALSIHRVHLDGPPFWHRKHWFETIVPRLYMVWDAIKRLRVVDEDRRAFVTAPNTVDQWIFLKRTLPYLSLESCNGYVVAKRDASTTARARKKRRGNDDSMRLQAAIVASLRTCDPSLIKGGRLPLGTPLGFSEPVVVDLRSPEEERRGSARRAL
eukprot:g2161.t1